MEGRPKRMLLDRRSKQDYTGRLDNQIIYVRIIQIWISNSQPERKLVLITAQKLVASVLFMTSSLDLCFQSFENVECGGENRICALDNLLLCGSSVDERRT
jgi:hypothetical protein